MLEAKYSPITSLFCHSHLRKKIGKADNELNPVCRGNRSMVAVVANGNLYPCHQLSGT